MANDSTKRTAAPSWVTPGGGSALPCLNSNISIENPFKPPQLSTQLKKSSFVLTESVAQLSAKYGIEKIGFLTLTFADHVVCAREAQRRFNSLASNVLKSRYLDYITVMERQKSGRIHYHLLVALPVDIRTGFDFDAVAKSDYKSASTGLRDEWLFWRKTARNYRFGRTELLPIKSTSEAIAKYVGKYIGKHIESRKPEDKGVNLVRYTNGARAGTTRFMFNSSGSFEWRRKLKIFAQIVQENHPERVVNSLSDLSEVLGPKWAYHHRDYILSLP